MPDTARIHDEGWEIPERIDQLDLFGEGRDRVLALAGVSIDEMERWRASGWISFDVRETPTLEWGEICEVTFIRNIARGGLSDVQIGHLLTELPKPYRYDPIRTAYSFALGWVRRPLAPSEVDPDEFIEENVSAWIERKVLLGEVDVLRSVLGEIIVGLPKAEINQDEEGLQ
jgi:hypothetical protein